MKKFTESVIESSENEEFDSKELEMGIKIESEHNDIYEELDQFLINLQNWNSIEDSLMPWTKEEFYVKIAKAHLREIPDYYTRLKIMEDNSK